MWLSKDISGELSQTIEDFLGAVFQKLIRVFCVNLPHLHRPTDTIYFFSKSTEKLQERYKEFPCILFPESSFVGINLSRNIS